LARAERRVLVMAPMLALLPWPAAAAEEPVRVTLPPPLTTGRLPLEAALQQRRSVRAYADVPLTLAQAGQLLWAAQGQTAPDGRRTAPSAGSLRPLELHLVAGAVQGLAPGVYRYLPSGHALARTAAGDRRAAVAASASGAQAWLQQAPALVVVTGVAARSAGRYGARADRYGALEAGAAAQNLLLQAVALGLGATFVGAFDDAALATLLGLPDGERPWAVLPVGRPR
jgi:SagB-type dehydrogenase family enzyme